MTDAETTELTIHPEAAESASEGTPSAPEQQEPPREKSDRYRRKSTLKGGRYIPSFDVLRLYCMVLVVALTFGLPIPFFGYIQPFLNFATGALFTLYGYLVLRDGADLKQNIKHAIKVFAILFAVYLPLTMLYLWFMYGQPFLYFTKRGIFNFIVLNYWNDPFCGSIWYVQATLYALIGFWIFRKLKKLDWLFCILLFVFAILIGELAAPIHFSFFRNEYIPGNFLTRAMPYMLLGRLIHRHYRRIPTLFRAEPLVLFLLGLLLCILEFVSFGLLDILGYTNHMIGFIPMAAAVCLYGLRKPRGGLLRRHTDYAKITYKGMYYTYNPLGYTLIILALLFSKTEMQYFISNLFVGVLVLILTIGGFWLFAYLKDPNRNPGPVARLREHRRFKRHYKKPGYFSDPNRRPGPVARFLERRRFKRHYRKPIELPMFLLPVRSRHRHRHSHSHTEHSHREPGRGSSGHSERRKEEPKEETHETEM